MNKLTKAIRDLLASKVDDLDAGNSNIDERISNSYIKSS